MLKIAPSKILSLFPIFRRISPIEIENNNIEVKKLGMTIECSKAIFGILAIAIAGCSTPVNAPPPPQPPEVSESAPSPTVTEPALAPETPTPEPESPVSSPASETPVTSQNFNSANPSTAPIEVGYVSELEGDITCRQTGGILAYAETENYLVYICADADDPTQPRYYRSFDRDGNPGLNLEATDYNPFKGRYFEFKNNEYSYLLQIPTGATPNPRLTVQFPDGEFIEEEVTRYLAKDDG